MEGVRAGCVCALLFVAIVHAPPGLAQQDDERTRGAATPGFLLAPVMAAYGLDANAPRPLQIVSTQVTLPPSREPTRAPNPPCVVDPAFATSAEAVAKGLGAPAGGITLGAPLLSPILQSKAVNDWVKARLGVANGPVVCQMMCVALPADARVVQEDTCVSDNEGRHCAMVQGHATAYTDYWGGVEAAGASAIAANTPPVKPKARAKAKGATKDAAKDAGKESPKDMVRTTSPAGQLVCGLAKSWSPSKTRIVSWNVWFQ